MSVKRIGHYNDICEEGSIRFDETKSNNLYLMNLAQAQIKAHWGKHLPMSWLLSVKGCDLNLYDRGITPKPHAHLQTM